MLTSLPHTSEVLMILGPRISTFKHATLSETIAFDKLFSQADKPVKVEGITACAISPISGRYLVVCDDCKRVLVFESADSVWSYRGEYKVPRRASCVSVTPDDSFILVGEKAGYVHKYNLDELNTAQALSGDEDDGDFMLGHLSLLTCLTVSIDGRLMATADRDEKIRISRTKEPYVIESFCLGHTGPVLDATFVDSSHLVSIATDGILRLWDGLKGIELDSLDLDPHLRELVDCSAAGTIEAFLALRLFSIEDLIIVGIRSHNCLMAVSLSRKDGDVRLKRPIASGSVVVSGVSFKTGDRLLDCSLANYEPASRKVDVITLMQPTLKVNAWTLHIPANEDDTPAQWSNPIDWGPLPESLPFTDAPHLRLQLLSELCKCPMDRSGIEAYEKNKGEMQKHIRDRHLRHQRKRRKLRHQSQAGDDQEVKETNATEGE
ncbi:unnamed protein product [Schistocephalus solidus]|uniref:tRNA (guanine-N(7)-)-methyltransferase non-catalytic subunit n=2 Tax=Schistocephalus solidus TaxID=70667 RepID=A0A183T2P7_SCHSO|nr:unnamed protein product [Schistocephalus solidus]